MMKKNRLLNLDLATLRSFINIAESGSMTRAAARLFMTQSAISMQIKRLEASLGLVVFERTAAGMVTTNAGEQLLGYALRLLDINDEAVGRLTSVDYAGKLRLGIPSDIIYPRMPDILKQFSRDHPRVQVTLSCTHSKLLKQQFSQGLQDVILTTETNPGDNGQVIGAESLIWTGAVDGSAWKQRPLPVGISKNSTFWPSVIKGLETVAMEWVNLVSTEDHMAIDAMTAADLCVGVELGSNQIAGRSPIDHRGLLPVLPDYSIVMYRAETSSTPMANELVGYLQRGYA